MNWGNVQIKLEPFNRLAPIDFNYLKEANGSKGHSATGDRNNNKVIPSKKSRSKDKHRNDDQHVVEPLTNGKRENGQRYHPYQMKKESNCDRYSRNQSKKGIVVVVSILQQAEVINNDNLCCARPILLFFFFF